MSTLTFPITKAPMPNYDIEKEDIVVRSPVTSGYTLTRLKFTRARTNPMSFKWNFLTDAEYLTLMNFFEVTTANGSLSFNFTFKTTGITRVYTVLFAKPPKTAYVGMGLWEVDLEFIEQF
jgi:hypothetical protein